MDKNHMKNREPDTIISQNQNVDRDLAPRRININMSTAPELAEEFGWDDTLARNVITYRNRKGGFSSWEDLKAVPGIDPDELEENRERFEF